MVRLRNEDIGDARLAFLRTVLAEAASSNGSPGPPGSFLTFAGDLDAPFTEAAVATSRETCTKEWPDDFRMRAYCQEQHDQGIKALRGRMMSTGDYRTIRGKCADKWPHDFRMRNYCEEQQLRALKMLR